MPEREEDPPGVQPLCWDAQTVPSSPSPGGRPLPRGPGKLVVCPSRTAEPGSGCREAPGLWERNLGGGVGHLVLDQSPCWRAPCPWFSYLTAGCANTFPGWVKRLWKHVTHSLQMVSVIPGDCGVGRSRLFPASLATVWLFIYGGCPLPCSQSGAPLQGLEGRPSLPSTPQVVFWPPRASGPSRWLSSPLPVGALGHSLSSGSSWEAAGGRTLQIMGIKGWELFAHSVQGAGVHGAFRASGRLTLGTAVMKML